MTGILHPWSEAAQNFGLPMPLPTIFKMDLVQMQDNATQETTAHVLVSIATPAGCTTVFLDEPDFREFMHQGRDILEDFSKNNHPANQIQVAPATTTDLRNELRGQHLLKKNANPNGRRIDGK